MDRGDCKSAYFNLLSQPNRKAIPMTSPFKIVAVNVSGVLKGIHCDIMTLARSHQIPPLAIYIQLKPLTFLAHFYACRGAGAGPSSVQARTHERRGLDSR